MLRLVRVCSVNGNLAHIVALSHATDDELINVQLLRHFSVFRGEGGPVREALDTSQLQKQKVREQLTSPLKLSHW